MISLFDVFVIFVDLFLIFSTYLNHEPPLLYFVFDRKILDFHPADGYLYAVQPASDCRHTSSSGGSAGIGNPWKIISESCFLLALHDFLYCCGTFISVYILRE